MRDIYPRISRLGCIFIKPCFSYVSRTVASALNSLAAITCEDVLQGLFNMELPGRKGATYARWISIFFGVFGFALIFVVERLGSVLQVDESIVNALF